MLCIFASRQKADGVAAIVAAPEYFQSLLNLWKICAAVTGTSELIE